MATTTTNYGFNIAEGSDTVNLLTQCYPNFTSLDSILYPIEQSGTTTATVTKVSNVHQIVRVNSNCNMLRFVATANYAAGDTFTVDGASVTATAVSGEALPAGAFVINQSVLCILNGSVLTVLAGGKSDPAATDVSYNNAVSGLAATDVQNAIDEVYAAIPTSLNADDVTYDNTGSDLTASNVQDAIDELAQGSGGSAHGIYELWVNSDMGAVFPTQTITFTTDLISQLDALILVCQPVLNEDYGSQWFEVEISKANASPFTPIKMTSPYYSTAAHYCIRSITNFTIVGTTINIVWGGGYLDTNANDKAFVPVRILGLILNS